MQRARGLSTPSAEAHSSRDKAGLQTTPGTGRGCVRCTASLTKAIWVAEGQVSPGPLGPRINLKADPAVSLEPAADHTLASKSRLPLGRHLHSTLQCHILRQPWACILMPCTELGDGQCPTVWQKLYLKQGPARGEGMRSSLGSKSQPWP